MSAKRRRSIAEWMAAEQGKHFCHCGCGKMLVVTRNHASNGIPKFIVGHAGRKDFSTVVRSKSEVLEWVAAEQGKHFCHCGCDGVIVITKNHHHNGIPKFIHGHQIRKRESIPEYTRFWNKVKKSDNNSCWLWLGCTDSKSGYGKFRNKDNFSKGLAHRFSYKLIDNKASADLDVLHKCDNPRCVNPNHLFLGSHADNMRDAALKGKFAKKLSPDSVLEIVRLVRSGTSLTAAGKLFGVNAPTVHSIMNGKCWVHVTGIKRD